MSFDLRPYQIEINKEARQKMLSGVKSMLIVSPTGSGKTVLTAHMLNTAANKGKESFFVVHRRELIKQSTTTFSAVGVRHGIIAAGFGIDAVPRIQIASIQTLTNRINHVRPPSLFIWDECHHIAAGSWKKIFLSYPNAFHIGLTATPERLDGKGLGEFFSDMIMGPSVASLIEDGYLCKYRVFCPDTVSMEGVHKRGGDFNRAEVSARMDKPSIIGDIVQTYMKLAPMKRAVVFAPSIEMSEHFVAQANASGIPAAHVDGGTDGDVRDRAIEDFKTGRIRWLSNVDLFGEGFDVPAIEVVIDAAPTLSLGRYLQRFGRALRPFQGKTEALYLDHAGNVMRHGLPDDDRPWSLDGRTITEKKSDDGPNIRVCKKCFAAMRFGAMKCGYCGYEFPTVGRVIEQVAGDLKEIDPAMIRRQRLLAQAAAVTKEDLVAEGLRRGYARPNLWAEHVWRGRQDKLRKEGKL